MVSLTNLALSAAALFSFASAAPAPVKRQDCIPDVVFTNSWPEDFCIGTQYGFHWEGGSGNYNLLATLTFDGQFSAHPAYFLFNSTIHDFGFLVPQSDPAKPNSTYAFMIQSVEGGNGDQSPHIPVKDCSQTSSA